MKALKLTLQTNGQYLLSGDMVFANIDSNSSQVLASLPPNATANISLAEVNTADSAGLALLVEWIKIHKKKQTQLIFLAIPKPLLDLAKLSYFTIPSAKPINL